MINNPLRRDRGVRQQAFLAYCRGVATERKEAGKPPLRYGDLVRRFEEWEQQQADAARCGHG